MNDKELDQILRKSLRPEVSEEELEKRRAQWHYTPKVEDGYLARYAALARSAAMGGILDWKKR